ncbi:MAG: Proline dehydrogenase [Methanosaeta sp. PtaB.Bin039]|nr:MAG: Proline dehydrogenase [Methanosaeta sp. PtaB.Bin039]
MDKSIDRWGLPDMEQALAWCDIRNDSGIRCVLDILGEDGRSAEDVKRTAESYANLAQEVVDRGLKASLSVKPSHLGALLHEGNGLDQIRRLHRQAADLGVAMEIDMEGRPLLPFTLRAAVICVGQAPITLALQAYLDRTADDLRVVLRHGITPRLTKGAYVGDISDFARIQERTVGLARLCLHEEKPFCLATHDPELISWARESGRRDIMEIGFLKGLAEETMIDLADAGWQVSEYVPFGPDRRAYSRRRERYLSDLQRLGRTAVP